MSRTFRQKPKKKSKNALPQEYVDKIQAMKPEDVAVEMAREQFAVDSLKKDMKEDDKIIDAQNVLERLDDEIADQDKIKKLQGELDDLIEEEKRDDAYCQAKLDVKLHKTEWLRDIRDRNRKIKLMKKTLQSHIASGVLKLKN